MNFSTALSFLFVATASAASNPFAAKTTRRNAQSKYTSKLVHNAKQTRKLDDAAEVDVTGYSVKFQQCQFVKTYSDDMAENEDSATVLATQRFVIFRLCPDSACDSCNYNYGEYIIDLDTYLQSTVEYQQEIQEAMCEACEECYAEEEEEEEAEDEDEDGRKRKLVTADCDTCYDECQKIENMEDNGYLDATNFLECQQIYDPEDDGGAALYAGPICASYGTKIKIGVFKDEDCMMVDSTKEVEDYLMSDEGYQMKLSHALLKTIYAEDTCYSCLAENDGDDDDAAAENSEMCQALYEASAKCENAHGFEGVADYGDEYANQASQEGLVCDYITSLKSGTYDESGEIIIAGSNNYIGGGTKTTGGQKFALTFFILGTVGLAVYSVLLHSKLTKGGKADLANQGGAMA